MTPDLDLIRVILKSPIAITVISLFFLYMLLSPILSPIQQIPGKLDIVIAKLDGCVERTVASGNVK